MGVHKIAEQTECFKTFLRCRGRTVIDDKCSEGWVRWKDNTHEGVVRLTAAGMWELVADPLKPVGFDRCANAAFHWDLHEVSSHCLANGFKELERTIQVSSTHFRNLPSKPNFRSKGTSQRG